MVKLWLVMGAVLAVTVSQSGADIKLSLPLVSAKVGATVSVTCNVTGEIFVGWFNTSGSKITNSSSANIRVESKGSVHTLKFVDIKVSYGSNDYECRGSRTRKSLLLHVAFNIDKVDKTQHIRIGTVDTINLGLAGFPKPTYTWKKDGKELNPSSDRRLSVLDDGSLRIDKVTKSDRGNYTCTVKQVSVEENTEIEVYAVELPKIKPFSVPRRYLTENYPASFICKATGVPAPKCKWLSPDGNQINSIGNIQVNGCNLTFTSVDRLFTKGKYTCVAFIEIVETGEEIGQASAVVEVVDVFIAPTIDPTQGTPESLKRGADYKLKCAAKGNPVPDVVWRRNGVIDPRQQQTKGQSIIEFTNIQVQDSGEYICEASNSAVDSDGNTIVKNLSKTINIESKPFIISLAASPKTVYSYLGNSDPTWVRCKFGGYPEPFVTMRFKEKLMSNASNVAEKKLFTNALKVFGTYKCHAKNKFGSTNYTIQLKLAGAPTEVQNLQAIPRCKSIELKWERPKQDGGMPIYKYVLTYSSMTRNINGDKTSFIITGLTNDEEYSISLRATSKAEWGPPVSLNVKTQEHCAPGRPVIYWPKSSLLTKDSFTLKWRRPEETGGDKDIFYTARYRVEKDNKKGPWITDTTKGLQYDFSDLENKVQYKFEVIAKNKGGESLPGERYIQTNFPGEGSSQSRLISSTTLITLVGGLLLLL